MTAAPWRIALLRGVNVGGYGKLPMAELRAAIANAGFAEVRTLLQSGNVVFRDGRSPEGLESALEALLIERFALTTEVMVRTPQQWAALIAANPFPDQARSDPSHLMLNVMKGPAKAGATEVLRTLVTGPEQAVLTDDALYMTFPEGIGTSRLNMGAVGRAVGARFTARNWNTVLKLAAAIAD
jgi:uncharacterized protein (DUF1697 family)